MNSNNQNTLYFGSELTRKDARHPDIIYISFCTAKFPCDLDVNVMFEKSEKEKIE
jgi:hypothetical protein